MSSFTNAQALRNYMNSVVLLNDDFIQFAIAADHQYPLFESQRRVLREAGWLDKVVNTAKAAQAKYQDVSYGLLASLTTKAMTALDAAKQAQQIDPAAAGTLSKVLQHVGQVGRFAANNPRLIMLCVGIVTSLVGVMHSNPAHAADAASNMDALIANNAKISTALDKMNAALNQANDALGQTGGGHAAGAAHGYLAQHAQPTQTHAVAAPQAKSSYQDQMSAFAAQDDSQANAKELADQTEMVRSYTAMGYSPAQAKQKALADFVNTYHRQPGQTPQ